MVSSPSPPYDVGEVRSESRPRALKALSRGLPRMNFLSDPISRTSGHPTTRHTDTRWSHIVIHGRGGPSATESAAGAAARESRQPKLDVFLSLGLSRRNGVHTGSAECLSRRFKSSLHESRRRSAPRRPYLRRGRVALRTRLPEGRKRVSSSKLCEGRMLRGPSPGGSRPPVGRPVDAN